MKEKSIGGRIREKRKSKGLTQAELSELLQNSEMTVRRWETDKRSPRLDEVRQLANVLETTPEYLLGETDYQENSNSLSDIIPSVASFEVNGKSDESYKTVSYWGDFIGNIQRIAQRGNLEEISVVENFLNSASTLLAMGKAQARVIKNMSSVDMSSHWNNNDMKGATVISAPQGAMA